MESCKSIDSAKIHPALFVFMITIKELINKIKWDEREKPSDYILVYIDLGKKKELA